MGILEASILASVFGLGIGAGTVFVYNKRKGSNATKKAEEILEKAKRESEKVKRDSVLEAKEEIHKLKLENEKETEL